MELMFIFVGEITVGILANTESFANRVLSDGTGN